MVQIPDQVSEPIPDDLKANYEYYRNIKSSAEHDMAELGFDNPVVAELVESDEYKKALQVYEKLKNIVEAGEIVRPITDAERAMGQKLDAFITGLLDEVEPLLNLE